MSDLPLTRERILRAAEDALRRFGPEKATVVDVARALGVSHGSVYRHFASKAALREAVLTRWLERINAPLATALSIEGSAPARLRHWFEQLLASKRRLAQDDPELFAAYGRLAAESPELLRAHIDDLVGQITALIAEGAARGEFVAAVPEQSARAVFDATVRFHNPLHAAEWFQPDRDAAFERLWALLMTGLGAHGIARH